MSFKHNVAMFAGAFIGIVIGHTLVRSLIGGPRREQYPQDQYQDPRFPPQYPPGYGQQPTQGVDSLKGRRLFDN